MRVSRSLPRRPLRFDHQRSALPLRTLSAIQYATTRKFEFEGVGCAKNPFDLALYTMLISKHRPRTIVEIGSFNGGSALWFAAQLRGMGIDGKVLSVDFNPVTACRILW